MWARPLAAEAALGDVGGVVADALQVAGGFERGDDVAQIAGHGLAQCEQADDELLDLLFAGIHLGVRLHRLGGGGAVAVEDGGAGEGYLALDHAAHLHDEVTQAVQLLLVAFHDVFLGHLEASQLKRPVMYCCVRSSRGAVNICAAVPTSTISPR